MTDQATGAHQPLVEAVPQEATHNLASDLRAGHQSNDTTCGDGLANDSRLHKFKRGISDVVTAYGEVDWGLMRHFQRPRDFACPTPSYGLGSGGWQGAGPSCEGGFDAGELLVGFSEDGTGEVLEYMDGSSNYAGTPPRGMDLELRGTGRASLDGLLESARTYIDAVRAGAVTGEVDAAARGLIAGRGHGERFGHGLGHGAGVAVHEAP